MLIRTGQLPFAVLKYISNHLIANFGCGLLIFLVDKDPTPV